MGDMKALARLRERVTVGTVLHVTNHDCLNGSGVQVVTRTYMAPDQTYRYKNATHIIKKGGPAYESQETKGKRRKFYFQWPLEGDDFEVEGNELRIYNPSHDYVYGNRAIILTMKFEFGK